MSRHANSYSIEGAETLWASDDDVTITVTQSRSNLYEPFAVVVPHGRRPMMFLGVRMEWVRPRRKHEIRSMMPTVGDDLLGFELEFSGGFGEVAQLNLWCPTRESAPCCDETIYCLWGQSSGDTMVTTIEPRI